VAALARHLAAGGDVNARTVYQSQLLHVAARHGRPSLVRLLLAQPGIHINSLDYGGMRRTPLHWACQRGDLQSVEALVTAGANTSVQGKSWQKLVQGRACGALVPSDSPPEECPADLCRNQTVRLALFQTPWSPEVHADFPDAFRAMARLLMLAATSSSATPPPPQHSQPQQHPRPQPQPQTHFQPQPQPQPQQQNSEPRTQQPQSEYRTQQPQQLYESPPEENGTVADGAAVGPSGAGGWPLSADVTRLIIAASAYPISKWVAN